ncbi:unnamed protein product [Amoebophrya sp. A120]|nr:unnamed protein product [Amoebophrya sp. A120]|eukprot:GSA120T00015841001.1
MVMKRNKAERRTRMNAHEFTEVYVDDNTLLAPKVLAQSVLQCFLLFLDELGVPYARHKIQLGEVVEVLGLVFGFSGPIPCFYISEKRKAQVSALIDAALAAGELHQHQAQRLQGKVMFIFNSLVDRALNPILRPLINRANDVAVSSTIGNRLKDCLLAAPGLFFEEELMSDDQDFLSKILAMRPVYGAVSSNSYFEDLD